MTTPTPDTPRPRVDPVTAAVIHGALENIAIEMGHKLMRMSYSSIIRESEDFGAALTDATGRQLCECKMSTPLQSGPIPGYVHGILAAMERRGETLNPGDVILHNDPYAGASHGPDFGLAVPIFLDQNLIGWSVTTAHHLDVGALTPGSCGIVDAVDTFAEGLQFKAIKVVDRGVPNAAVWSILRDNIRAPDLVVGDMEAQIKAAEIGAERYLALVRQYGLETLSGAYEDLMDYSERLMRDAIGALPDGDYAATTQIDGYLDDPDPSRSDLVLAVTLKVRGDAMVVDLTGTAPQLPDKPINMPLVGTVDCAIWLTLRSILLDSAVWGNIPQNAGLTRPIEIVAPKGCLANPTFPAPVIARFCPGNQLADTVMKALAQVVPEQVSAGIGNLRVIAFSGLADTGQHWVHMEIQEGAYGGRFGMDGMDAVDTLYANTRNNPIEDMESHLPLRVGTYELREDVAAPGRWRGGIGTVRAFEYLVDGGFSIEGEGHKHRPWGFDGGAKGAVASLTRLSSDAETALPSKVPYHRVRAGDQLISTGPCGGGYGDPMLRDPEAVLDDVLDGLVSVASAERDYGVVIRDGQLDPAATERLRTP